MGKIWINPMTGQQINLPSNQMPSGCWTAIGDAPDDWCKNITVITPDSMSITNNQSSEIDLSVGADFTDEDDQF